MVLLLSLLRRLIVLARDCVSEIYSELSPAAPVCHTSLWTKFRFALRSTSWTYLSWTKWSELRGKSRIPASPTRCSIVPLASFILCQHPSVSIQLIFQLCETIDEPCTFDLAYSYDIFSMITSLRCALLMGLSIIRNKSIVLELLTTFFFHVHVSISFTVCKTLQMRLRFFLVRGEWYDRRWLIVVGDFNRIF